MHTATDHSSDIPQLGPNEFFIVLDDSRGTAQSASYVFFAPVAVVSCRHPEHIEAALAQVQQGVDRGLHAAGWLTYELGYVLERPLQSLMPALDGQPPLLHFGLFERRVRLNAEQIEHFWLRQAATAGGDFGLAPPRLSLVEADYIDRIERIHEYIRSGDTYQVNYTQKYHFRAWGNLFEFYRSLRRAQSTEFSAFINDSQHRILCLSPELFYRRRQSEVACRPMKGTAPRGSSDAEQAQQAAWLRSDSKNLAENLMIVDLLRNDLGRLATTGSVQVPKLFDVETYGTLLQMTSTVTAQLRQGVTFPNLIKHMFPCGSITGAPKIRTMQIIRELEPAPRGVYTGSIGYVSPDESSCFNVAIRTITVAADGTAEMGVGSGIIIDSEARSEYRECQLKGRFMTDLAAKCAA